MNPYAKNLLAVLGLVPVLLSPWVMRPWYPPVCGAIAALLGVFHVTPITLPAQPSAPSDNHPAAKAIAAMQTAKPTDPPNGAA